MLDILHSLSVAGQELQAVGVSDDTSEQLTIVQRLELDDDHIPEATKLTKSASSELWTQLQGQKVVMADVARAFGSIMALAPQSQALRAAAVYTTLLNTPGCPVLSLFDRIICSSLLKLIRDVAFTRSAKAKKKGNTKPTASAAPAPTASAMFADGDSEDELMLPAVDTTTEPMSLEESIEIMTLCSENFALVLKSLALRDQPETARNIAETFADVSSVPTLPSLARTSAMNVLAALLSPGHGGIREMSAMVFKLLTPHVLGTLPGGKVAAKDATVVRVAALNFVKNALMTIPGCEEAAAALMRHAVLKTPEKADGRAAAVETAVTLCKALGPQYLHCFVGFIVKLSRNSKANQRFMAVELAAAFIEAFESPFDPETAAPTHHIASPLPLLPPPTTTTHKINGEEADKQDEGTENNEFVVRQGTVLRRGWISAQGEALVPAPWGAVLLAVLHQRSSDKIPAVRARALHHIATLASNSTRAKETAFIIALAAAEAVDFSVVGNSGLTPGSNTGGTKKKTGKGKKNADGSEDEEEEQQEGSPASHKGAENTPLNGGGDNGGGNAEEEEERVPTHPSAGSASVHTAMMSGENAVLFRTLAFPVPAALLFLEEANAKADLKPLLTLARLRCRDSKGAVRKSAVQLLQALIFIEAGRNPLAPVLEPRDVGALEAAAGDSLLTVRKAALLAAAQLAASLPWDGATAELWVSAGLPLIRDPESAIQDAVVDQVEELILSRAAAKTEIASEELRPILAAISRGGAAGRACLARTCAQLRAKNRLQAKKVTTGLEKMLLGFQQRMQGEATAAEEEEPRMINSREEDIISGTWILYAEIAAQAPSAPSWEFLQSQWTALTSNSASNSAQQQQQQSQHAAQLLRVIATAAAEFPPDQALALCAQLRANLETLALPPGSAAAHVAALAQLTRTAHGDGTSAAATSSMASWTASLFSLCESGLAAAVEALRCSQNGDATALAGAPSALFITGEVALLRASTPSSRLVTLVQALTSASLAAGLNAAASEKQTPMPTPIVARNDDGNEKQEEEEETAAAAAAAPPASIPASVQALAWVTLGKLCLVNEYLAKKCVPLFVQELGRAASPAVRNNIMVALADLVINYTALVDSHIPRLAACLRDPNELVRTQALGLLANLLQKDYVKWRGPLFLRFMLALIDDSPRVAAMAEFLLSDALDSKLPNLAYNHFVEAVFVLNDCQVGLAGGAAAAAAMADLSGAGAAEREAFCLKGADSVMRFKRDAIYQVLLRRMAPEHKFATSARLCQEVLGAAADGALPLSECSEVIGDALRVLSCKGIKVAATRASKDNDFDTLDPQADAQAIAGAAKGRLVSQMMKKHLVEAVVPVIIELKRMMEASRHPLLADLMAAAAAMLKDHKAEIEDILAADRQLAKEILYDIKQAEAAEAARAAEEKEAAAGGAAGGVGAEVVEKPDAAVEAPAKTPGANGVPPNAGKTPYTAKNTPPAGTTPKAIPRSSTRPPGTSGNTPIAAQVLRQTADASAELRPGSTTKTPGSNHHLLGRGTPAGKPTHGTAAGGGGTGRTTTGRKSLSRLARMSSGTAPRTGGASVPLPSPAQPHLRSGHEKIEANMTSGGGRRQKNDDDDEEEEEEDHVELKFTLPGVQGEEEGEEEGEDVSRKMWNVSPAVLPTTTSSAAGGGAADGVEVEEMEVVNEETTTPAPAKGNNDEFEETVGRTTRGRSTRRATSAAAAAAVTTEPKTRRKRKA